MKKRILAFVLLVGMVLLCACEGSSNLDLSRLSPQSLTTPVPAKNAEDIYEAFMAIASQEVALEQEEDVTPNSPDPHPDDSQIIISENNRNSVLYGDYLYMLSNADFKILQKQSNKLMLIANVSIAPTQPANMDYYQFANGIYVSGNRMVIILNRSYFTEEEGQLFTTEQTCAYLYDISTRHNPVLLDVFSQDGIYQDVALIDSTLYLISNSTADLRSTDPAAFLPKVNDNGADITIPTERIYLTDAPGNASYCIVSSILIEDAKRSDVCAFLGSCNVTEITEDNVYLARTARKSLSSDPYDKNQYSVTDHATAALTQIVSLSNQPALTLSTACGLAGEALALNYSHEQIQVITGTTTARYKVFTDETYGWTNRLDEDSTDSTLVTALDASLKTISSIEYPHPSSAIQSISFYENTCYITVNRLDKSLAAITFNPGEDAKITELTRNDSSMNHFLFTKEGILNLSLPDAAQSSRTLSLSLYDGNNLQLAAGSSFVLDSIPEGTLLAVGTRSNNVVLLSCGGTVYLLQVGKAIRELGMPKMSIHSGTNFIFDKNHLYATAPDAIFVVNLQTAQVEDTLSFGVG